MIIVDDMRHIIDNEKFNFPKTPNIKRLEKRGTSFTRAYAQYANCSPSRMSFLTGLSPEKLGHEGNYNQKTEFNSHATMPKYFKFNQYYTSSFGKVYHDIRDDSSSWDLIHDIDRNNNDLAWECYGLSKNQILEGTDRPAVENADLPLHKYNDFNITSAVERHLEKVKDTLFFTVVGFRKPHLPFAAPKKYWDLYEYEDVSLQGISNAPIDGDSIVYQWSELSSYDKFFEYYASNNYRSRSVKSNDAKELIHGYLASVSYIDELVGRLINKLEELHLHKNTIIVFMSDHGLHLGEQQIWGKHSSYEMSTHVPLIIFDPSESSKGVKCNNFVELIDIYPTLIDLNGLKKNTSLPGNSLSNFFDNDVNKFSGSAFSQYQSFQKDKSFNNYMAYAIYTEDFNYIEWQDLSKQRTIVQRELYDVSKNRSEIINISAEPGYSKIQEDLSREIRLNFGF